MRRFQASLLAFSTVLFAAGLAHAQDTKDDATTDHSRVVGHLGVGYFGALAMPLGSGAVATNAVPLQLVGVRYWFNDGVGLDVALGWAIATGSQTTNGTSSDRPSLFGIGVHAGVPLALYNGKHYSFVIIPQVTYGHESQTIKPAAGSPAGTPDTTHDGNHFQIGAAAGAIIHFGFLGIPQLTLDATVGLLADATGGNTKVPNPAAGGGTTNTSFTGFTIATSTAHEPWNIFFTNVAAIYHF
jgi:hypothetical protein